MLKEAAMHLPDPTQQPASTRDDYVDVLVHAFLWAMGWTILYAGFAAEISLRPEWFVIGVGEIGIIVIGAYLGRRSVGPEDEGISGAVLTVCGDAILTCGLFAILFQLIVSLIGLEPRMVFGIVRDLLVLAISVWLGRNGGIIAFLGSRRGQPAP
jgi:hypothetical protein